MEDFELCHVMENTKLLRQNAERSKQVDGFDYGSAREKRRRRKCKNKNWPKYVESLSASSRTDEFDFGSGRLTCRTQKNIILDKYLKNIPKRADEFDIDPSRVEHTDRKDINNDQDKPVEHDKQAEELQYTKFLESRKLLNSRRIPTFIDEFDKCSSSSRRHQRNNRLEPVYRSLSSRGKAGVQELLRQHVEEGGCLNTYGDTGVDVTTDARVLFDAVRHGKNHLVRFILDASSVDIVNSRDLHGKTPLMACCYTKEEGARDNTVRLLLRHGADVNATDDCGRTALSYVCERRCNDILRILIKEHNVDPDITDTNGNTPLIYSAMVGNDIACDILIRHFRRLGLSIEARNDEGFTALLMAAKHGNITCAQILVGQGKASTQSRDSKYGLSVEEWLAKKGFTLQDIKPVRQDGKGRSRFVKLANIAAICSAPKKHVQTAPGYGEIDFHLNRFQLGKIDDDDSYHSDATTGTDISDENFARYLDRYSDRYNDIDLDFAQKHYRIYPYRQNSRPKLKTSSTQTQPDETDDAEVEISNQGENDGDEIVTEITVPETARSDTATDITLLQHDPKLHLEKKYKKNIEDNPKIVRSTEKTQDRNSREAKRFSLPEIEHTPMVSRNEGGSSERKRSLDVLPEKLIASIDLGDGRRQSIQLHPDSIRNKVYWSPVNDDRSEDNSEKILMPLKFERERGSVSDSETSMNEDGPIF